jgi:hypothetical protein
MRVAHASGTPKVYGPSRCRISPYTIGVVFALGVVTAKYGKEVLSPVGLSAFTVGISLAAYMEFFGLRLWVSLYENRLEIRTALSKLIHDRFGLALCKPVVIYYGQIKALRKTRGFGGFNALGILLRQQMRGQRAGYGIPYQGVKDYADLEAELLRRVPATCELYSVDFLGHRGPFN